MKQQASQVTFWLTNLNFSLLSAFHLVLMYSTSQWYYNSRGCSIEFSCASKKLRWKNLVEVALLFYKQNVWEREKPSVNNNQWCTTGSKATALANHSTAFLMNILGKSFDPHIVKWTISWQFSKDPNKLSNQVFKQKESFVWEEDYQEVRRVKVALHHWIYFWPEMERLVSFLAICRTSAKN